MVQPCPVLEPERGFFRIRKAFLRRCGTGGEVGTAATTHREIAGA